MTGTATEPVDQPVTTPIVLANGSMLDAMPQVDKLVNPANSAALYVFSVEWCIPYNGQTLNFRPGVGYALDAMLLAFLTAQSAPITAV